MRDKDSDDSVDAISLKTNLRLKIMRQIPISHNRFPPSDKYHYSERITYRSYNNQDITIMFEIIRPVECHKKFEELLLPKPESKFIIKLIIRDPKNLDKYLKYLTEGSSYKELCY